MKTKQQEKHKAVLLRKQGSSIPSISRSLNVSKSSVSSWVRSVSLSTDALQKLAERRHYGRERARETRNRQKQQRLHEANEFAKKIIKNLKPSLPVIQLVCALLYWCEGAKLKNGGTLAFTNSDPLLMNTFLSLLRKGFDLDEKKFRLVVHIHDYHNSKTQLQFWSKITTIPLEQVYKPYKKSHTGTRSRDGYEGCASVRYHDLALGRKLESIAQAFMKGPIV